MRITERACVSLALLAAVTVLCAAAVRMTPRAALLPLAAGLPALALSAAQAVRDLRRPDSHGNGPSEGHHAVLALLVLLGGVWLIGLAIALPLYAGLAWKRSGAGWRAALVAALLAAAVVQAGFTWLLPFDAYGGVVSEVWRAR